MSDLIRDLADSAISDIKDEINGMSEDDLTTWDHERFIHETIDRLVPSANWELIKLLKNDTNLGFESDIHMLSKHDNIFTFLLGRVFEEIEQLVRCETQGWFDGNWDAESNSFPNDSFDDGWALASAGFGTDEVFGHFGGEF